MTDAGKPGLKKPTQKEQDELDEALEESFPASDPPAPAREPTQDEEAGEDKKSG